MTQTTVVSRNPVKRALATAVDLPNDHAAIVRCEAKRIKVLRQKAERARKELFGVEQGAAKLLDAAIKKLRAEEQRVAEIAAASGTFGDIKFKTIALEVLGWRRKSDRFPSLAIFDLDSPTCQFRFSGSMDYDASNGIRRPFSIKPSLPATLQERYADIGQLLGRRRDRMDFFSVSISAQFSGTIPPATREKIRKWKGSFERVFMLVEAPEWVVKREERRPKPAPILVGDPLVVGYRGGQLFLIDVFDTTPTENYIAKEFAL